MEITPSVAYSFNWDFTKNETFCSYAKQKLEKFDDYFLGSIGDQEINGKNRVLEKYLYLYFTTYIFFK